MSSREVNLNDFESSPKICPLVYSKEDDSWVCGTANGEIRQIPLNGGEMKDSTATDSPIRAIALNPRGDGCAICTENYLHHYGFPDVHEKDPQLIRSTLPTTHCAYSSDGDIIFASSGDADLIIHSVDSKESRSLQIRDGGIRTFALSEDDKFICVLDNSSNAVIYQMKYQNLGAKEYEGNDREKSVNSVTTTALLRDENIGFKPSWLPSKEAIAVAVPSSSGSALVLFRQGGYKQLAAEESNSNSSSDGASGRVEWDEVTLACSELSPLQHGKADLNMAVFSPNGRYLATADAQGAVLLWSVDLDSLTSECVLPSEFFSPVSIIKCADPAPLLDLCWGPKDGDNYLVLATQSAWAKLDDAVAVAEDSSRCLPTGAVSKKSKKAAKDVTSSGITPAVSKVALKSPKVTMADLVKDDMDVENAGIDRLSNTQPGDSATKTNDSAKAAETETNTAEASKHTRLKKKAAQSAASDDEEDLFGDEPVAPKASAPTSSKAAAKPADKNADAGAEVEVEADLDNSVSIEKIKQATKRNRLIDDEAVEMDDEDDDEDDDDYEAEDGEEENADPREKAKKRAQKNYSKVVEQLTALQTKGVDEASAKDIAAIKALIEKSTKDSEASRAVVLQPPFQPSTTTNDEKKRRYLVWNSIGNITCREESMSNRIEIRFANTGGRNKSEAFSDNMGFTMAALSYEGAIFANEPEEEPEGQRIDPEDPENIKRTPGSSVHYHAFPGQVQMNGANETFTITLSHGEKAQAVAVGMGWCAVATSHNMLRILSSTGVQLAIISLKGPVVCLCGYGHQLAVFYHAGAPFGDSFNIAVDVMEISAQDDVRRLVLSTTVPLTPKSTLKWTGFDVDTGVLVTIDSEGVTRVLMRLLGWQWTPVLDIKAARKTSEHTLWPVCVKGNRLAHVLLNGESRPAIYPQPIVSVKTFKMPIAETKEGKDKGAAQNERVHQLVWEGAKTAHLEAFKAEAATTGQLPEGLTMEKLDANLIEQQVEEDKAILKLFQEACRMQRNGVAFDLARRLRTDQGMQGAIKLANNFGRNNVAQAVEDMIFAKQELVREQEELMFAQQQGYQSYAEYDNATNGNGNGNGDYEMSYENAVPSGASSHRQQSREEPVQKPAFSSGSSAAGASSRSSQVQVGPAENDEEFEVSPERTAPKPTVKVAPVNPFAKKPSSAGGMASPVGKRKSALESIKDLKGTPSPTPKKPMLSRQSSFSQNARSKLLSNKNFL